MPGGGSFIEQPFSTTFSYSPILNITLIEPAHLGKFDAIYAMFLALEDSSQELVTHDLSGGNVIVSSTQYVGYHIHKTTGNTVARTLTVPDSPTDRIFMVWNGGSYDLTVEVLSGGTATVGAGEITVYQSDGSGLTPIARSGYPDQTFLDLTDVPAAYTGDTLERVRVNAGATAIEDAAVGTEIPEQIDGPTEFTSTTPDAPLIGLTGFIRKRANAKTVSFVDPRDRVGELQNLMAQRSAQYLIGQGQTSNTDGNLSSVGDYAFGFDGGVVSPNAQHRTPTFENYFKSQILRTSLLSASSANAQFYWVAPSIAHARGSVADTGGFLCVYRFGVHQHYDGSKFFVGLGSDTGSLTSSWASNQTTLGASLGIIKEAGDSNWQIIQKVAGSTSFTKTDLGSNFPANSSDVDWYELRLFCAPGGVPYWSLERKNTGDLAGGQFVNDATLPGVTQLLYSAIRGQVSATITTGVGIDYSLVYMESALDVI